jgi:hypothetical protein
MKDMNEKKKYLRLKAFVAFFRGGSGLEGGNGA